MSEIVVTFEGLGQAITTDKSGNIIYKGDTTPKFVLYIDESRNILTPYIVTYENFDVNKNKLISTTKLPASVTGSINNKGPIPIEAGISESVPGLGENFSDGDVTFNTYYVLYTPEGEQEAVLLAFIYSSGLIGPNKDLYYASCDVVGITNIEPEPTNALTNNISKYSKFFIQNFQRSINPVANIRNYVNNTIQFSSKIKSILQKLQKNKAQESSHQLLKQKSLEPSQQPSKPKSKESSQQISKKIPQQQPKLKKNCCCKNKK
jgi:hypothetical protein